MITRVDKPKWNGTNVLVTGGASFIGSHLVDKLVGLGSTVTVVDDLSSGKLENLAQSLDKIHFVKKDLEYISKGEVRDIFRDKDVVFHLAAVHGGRGYIQSHPADVCSNVSIDHHVLEGACNSKVESIVFTSTACVYPDQLQSELGSDYKLKEGDTNTAKLDGYMSADIEYGWGKLMGEIQLNAFIKQFGMKGSSVRLITVYGPRENETHAIIALIAKATEKMDPYPIWGDGQQERDFTYVEDIVDGMIKASENISDGTPVNLGTGRRYKIVEVAELIFNVLGWRPFKLEFERTMPVGPVSRAIDNTRAKEILNWEPKFSLEEGLYKTIQWYNRVDWEKWRVKKEFLWERT